MTISEKRAVLRVYCEAVGSDGCSDCLLYDNNTGKEGCYTYASEQRVEVNCKKLIKEYSRLKSVFNSMPIIAVEEMEEDDDE